MSGKITPLTVHYVLDKTKTNFWKNLMKKLTVVAIFALLTGCATTSNIAPQYVSPTTYASYDCPMLQSEVARVSKLAESTKNQNISLGTGVGFGIAGGRGGIYPTVSIGMGTGSGQRQAKNNTLARLYGEHDAMILAGRQKGCGFVRGVKVYGE